MAAQQEGLAERLLGWLRTRNDVGLIDRRTGARDERVPTISFVVERRRSGAVVTAVNPHRVGIRFGDFYARRLTEPLGLESQDRVVRVSMVHYNTLEAVDWLTEALDRALAG